jgi:hypothetical protein
MPASELLLKYGLSLNKGENTMFRKIALFALIGILAVAAYGSAASLGVLGGTIQAGSDTNLKCTEAVGVTGWGLEIDDNTVRNVKIGVPEACFGNALFVQVNGGTPISVDPIDAVVEQVNFPAPFPSPEAITSLNIWIEGPYGLLP